MVLPCLLCAAELVHRVRRERSWRSLTVVHALAAGVIIKGLYNLAFVQVWNQGQWYYTVSVAVANLILVIWVDRILQRVLSTSSKGLPRLSFLLTSHALFVLVAFNIFISRRNADGPVENFRLLANNQPLRQKLKSVDAARFIEFDDGFTSYVADMPAAAGLGLALDREAAESVKSGNFFSLMYARGFRVAVAHGDYASIIDNATTAQARGLTPELVVIHASEFLSYELRPLGGDGYSDGLSYYQLVPRHSPMAEHSSEE